MNVVYMDASLVFADGNELALFHLWTIFILACLFSDAS